MELFLYIALLITLALAVLAYQNMAAVTVVFYAWDFTGTLASVLALAFTAGIITGILILLPGRLRAARARLSQRRRIKELERDASAEETGLGEAPEQEE